MSARLMTVVEGPASKLTPDVLRRVVWTPWIKADGDPKDLMAGMVANKWIRDRGGLLPSEEITICVIEKVDNATGFVTELKISGGR